MASIKQHESLRVPMGWKDQDKALIGQLERIFDDIYKRFGRLSRDDLGKAMNDLLDQMGSDIDTIEETMVTAVSYNALTSTITVTINNTTSDVVAVAVLDANGKVPASQLPSYVDDVEEYEDLAHFPPTGEADKIYVALDTGFTYRWSGSLYVRLNTYDEATQSSSGLMSASDKTKLDGIETGANKTMIYNGMDHNAPGWALDAQTGYTLSQSDAKTKHGIAYIAVLHSGNWQLNSGTNAAIGDFIFVNGNLGVATAAITGGSTNIVENTNWVKVAEGAGNRLQSIKADKVTGATNNNFAALDSNGNLKDSGHKHSDYLTQHQDLSGYAKKSNLNSTTLAETESALMTIWQDMSDNESRIGRSYVNYVDSTIGFDGYPGIVLYARYGSGTYMASIFTGGPKIVYDYYYSGEHHWSHYWTGASTWGQLAGQ